MNRRALPVVVSLLFLASSVSAQEIPIQTTNPTSLRWYRVTTPHFKVLFPHGFEEQAMRMANTLEFIREPEAASMGVKPRPISIILQNQSTTSNAFVALAPRRSEFYTMPPQNPASTGTNDWLSLLASHEYRHIAQYQRSIVGFNKVVYYLFGQEALSLAAFAAAPQWFWEGDAVATETAFTKSGRGRIPNFNLLFRTNLMEGRTFNYQKQYVRSYRNGIPDHYVLGYHMITYLRNKTNDANIWDKVITRAWTVPFVPFTFSMAIKKESGMGVSKLYREMADSLRKDWTKQLQETELTKFTRLNNRTSKAYLDFLYPQQMEDGSIVALTTGIGQVAKIVKFSSDGRIQKTFTVGPMNDGAMLSTAKGKVVWNEYRYDPRWLVRNYTIVKGINFDNHTNKDLSKHSRYAGSAISPDGTRVVTVESTSDYKISMLVIDYDTQAIVKRFDNPNNDWIVMPRWTPDGNSIVAVRLSKEGKKISLYDYETGGVVDLMNAGNENIGHPVMTRDGKYVLYNSPYSGIDNIYAFELSSGKKFQVTSSRYGSYNPSVTFDGKQILYNDQQRNGMDIVSAPYDPSAWKEINEVKVPDSHFYDKLVTQEEHPDIIKDVPQTQYPVSKYKSARSLINIHSWGPYIENSYVQPSYGVTSRNLLGTTVVDAGYKFDIFERTGTATAGISYQGLYPVLDFNVMSGKRQASTGALDKTVQFTWKETTMTGGVRLPLLLTRSKYLVGVQFKNWIGFTQVTDFRHETIKDNLIIYTGTDRFVRISDKYQFVFDTQVGNGRLLYNQATFSFSRTIKQSRRDFNPRFGQLLDVESYTTPYGGDFNGKLTAARAIVFFPGLAKQHSLSFRLGYQVGTSGVDPNRYSFRNRVFRPRGFAYPFDSKFEAFSANYALPLLYPDLQFGPFLNIQRLRTNVFYDWGKAAGNNYFYANNGEIDYSPSDRTYRSVGAEFTVDVNVMRLLQQLDLGLRTTLINPTGAHPRRWVVEFVLGTLNF